MNRKAFSLIELSIVILIIGILIAGVVQGNNLFLKAKLKSAQSLTQSSPVQGIADLMAWYETTQDKSFGQLRPNNQDAIGRWLDINPQRQAIDAIQNTASNKPLFIEDCINGLPCLKFDGSNDLLDTNIDISYTKMPSMTIFGVFNNNSGLTAYQTLMGQDNGGWDRDIFVKWPGGGGFAAGTFGMVKIAGIDTLLVTKFFSLVIKNGISNGSKAYINGSSTPVTFTENHTDSGGNPTTTIGAMDSSSGHPLSGNIAEIIIYGRALKNEERMAVEKYLSQKWGIKE